MCSALLVAPAMGDEISDRIHAFVEPFADFAMFNGGILIDQGGEVAFASHFGSANYEHAVPNAPETRFRIASVSKSVTDAAIGRLIDAGELSLDASLSDFLPGFPSADEITIEQLVTHRSGIPHSNDQPWGDGLETLELDEIVDRLAGLPLDFAPGTDRSYSNGGYAVLAKVLEVATGQKFAVALRQLVFEPLGMADSGHIADSRAIIRNLATGYEPGPYPGERRRSRYYAVEGRPGGGSLYATVADVHRFANGIFRDGFLTEQTTERLFDG
ncbi:MAG: serine hydrolase domain-containing protein [Pseudomonadota bacterium]